MTSNRVLVLSTVHQADDPRIRHRTVGVLAASMPVRYATKPPGPADGADHEWVALRGGRLRRMAEAARESWRPDVGLVCLHDPELVPLGIAVRALRRIPVVFDVHEDVPAQIRTKTWLPWPLRLPLAAFAWLLLRLAEATLTVTLAEPNYQRRFRREHPVLPNYPDIAALPAPQPDGGAVVYVGDVTAARGALLAVRAVAAMRQPRPVRLIGRCEPPLRERLEKLAAELGVDLDLPGFLAHPEAMAQAAAASVGLSPLTDTPNYRESLPTKTLEYLALGVPVLASDLPGTANVIAGLPGVRLLPAGDVSAWTAALDAVCGDDELRAATAGNAEAIRQRFTWPADEVRSLYADLMAGSA